MDFARIRILTITALFADDELFDLLVLKGGNAISLVHRLSVRTSLDLDFSLESDFPDVKRAEERMIKALGARFETVGLVVFDARLEPRPREQGPDHDGRWGGYRLFFKLISRDRLAALKGDIEAARRESVRVGPEELRTFTVDFSKFEYCRGKGEAELDDYTIFVYSPVMLAVEKLRAICQQMPQYRLCRAAQGRARDFYDIHELVTKADVRFGGADTVELIRNVFAAKSVPLSLVAEIAAQREFHRLDWPAVEAAVNVPLQPFDYYFDFVVNETQGLHALGVEEFPIGIEGAVPDVVR